MKKKVIVSVMLSMFCIATPVFAIDWKNKTAEKIYNDAGKTVSGLDATTKAVRDTAISVIEGAGGGAGFVGNMSRTWNNVSNDDIHKQAIKDVAIKTEVNTRQVENARKTTEKVKETTKQKFNEFVNRNNNRDFSKLKDRGNY